MKILLTGATGYIGKRLLPILVNQGHEVICCVRDKNRFYCPKEFLQKVEVIEVDFLKRETLETIPNDIEAVYYLIHSMSGSANNYDDLERISAENFVEKIDQTTTKQVIYLSGIVLSRLEQNTLPLMYTLVILIIFTTIILLIKI